MFFCFSLVENKAASHFEQMSSSFRSKVQHLAESVISDVTSSASASASAPVTVPAPAAEVAEDGAAAPSAPAPATATAPAENEPNAYHQESRASEFGAWYGVHYQVNFNQVQFIYWFHVTCYLFSKLCLYAIIFTAIGLQFHFLVW